MASGEADGSGRRSQDVKASVAGKLFNSGRVLGSFIDTGNNSDASSVRPPVDIEDDVDQSRGLSKSAIQEIASPSDSNAAQTPRTPPKTVEGGSEEHDITVNMQYPPSSQTVAARHPQLLPQIANLDHPHSSSAGDTSTNNSSGQSSFDYTGTNQDRITVNHPTTSNQGITANSSAFNSNTALLHSRGNSNDYNDLGQNNGTSEDGQPHAFDKIAGGKLNMQIFGTPPVGIIGVHKPREIIRLDRDYISGEICQFWSGFPLELEGRITATQHLNVMNKLNAILASAFDPYKAIFDNLIAVLSLYLSTWLLSSHYDKEIAKFEQKLQEANRILYNPAGLNLLNPKKNGYLFLELEYY